MPQQTNVPNPTLLLIDGHSLAFRAFFALLPTGHFVTSTGQHTEAVHGFVSMLLKLIKDENPTHVGVAFDLSRESFRTREYAEYKGGRAQTPPEFIGQIPLLHEVLDAMRVRWVTKDDYEADDILATLSTQGAQQGFDVLVVSGDRDSFQLIDDRVTVLYPSTLGVSELKRYDAQAVFDKYKVWPQQYPELAALTGEKADNLPGITKVGPVTAAKWIAEWGTVDEIIAHADEIKGVVGENLRNEKDNARRNRHLNALVRDLELPVTPSDFTRRAVDETALRAIFAQLEFRSLLTRVLSTLGSEPGGVDSSTPTGGTLGQTSPRGVEAVTMSGSSLAAWLEAKRGERVSVQLGLDVDGSLTRVGLATTKEAVLVPAFIQDAQLDPALLAWLSGGSSGAGNAGGSDHVGGSGHVDDAAPAAGLDDSVGNKLFFDAKTQLKALAILGVSVCGVVDDTRIAHALLTPDKVPTSLDQQVQRLFGETLPVPDANQLLPETEALSPANKAWYVARAAEALDAELSREPDDERSRVLDDIEVPLIPVLARMELTGVAVDADILAQLRADLASQGDEYQQAAFAAIGHEVNLGSPKQLQTVLFDELRLPKTRQVKTGYSTDAAALVDLRERIDPETSGFIFVDALLRHRDVTKLRQIIETLQGSIAPDQRIHTTYDQVGAATGRLSSNDPNLQNIPVRTETGRRIRAAFRSGEGYECLLTADYSQIEMRIMAHLSQDAGLIDAFRSGEDLHRYVGSHVFGVAPEDVTPEMRAKVKAMSYGLAYGLSAFGLAKQLRIDRGEARALMDDYFTRFGGVRDYLHNVVAQAKERGYTETVFGRRRPFPDFGSTNRVLRDNAERAALNSPIQGTAADIMKIAMLGVAADLKSEGLSSRMLLQVHDELIFEVAEGEWDTLERIVTHRMSTAAELSVPLTVQVGRGTNWDSAGH